MEDNPMYPEGFDDATWMMQMTVLTSHRSEELVSEIREYLNTSSGKRSPQLNKLEKAEILARLRNNDKE